MTVFCIFLIRLCTIDATHGITAVGLLAIEPFHMAEIVVRRPAVYANLRIEIVIMVVGSTGGVRGMMVVRTDDDAITASPLKAVG